MNPCLIVDPETLGVERVPETEQIPVPDELPEFDRMALERKVRYFFDHPQEFGRPSNGGIMGWRWWTSVRLFVRNILAFAPTREEVEREILARTARQGLRKLRRAMMEDAYKEIHRK